MIAFSTLSRMTRFTAFGIACSVIAACAQSNAETNSEPMAMHHAMTAASSKAADLRSALDELLSEHVILAAEATNAAIAGRQPDFQAAAAALDQNSVAISKAVGSVYGAPKPRLSSCRSGAAISALSSTTPSEPRRTTRQRRSRR